MSMQPKIAISDDFLQAYARLPKAQQKKARAFLEKFRRDPTASAIDYEPIHDMADDRVRTVRIDQAYRAVILHPRRGDVFTAVWVDHHDEAHAWAKRKRFEVNPASGALQVFDTFATEAAPQDPPRMPEGSVPATVAGEVMPGKVPEGRLLGGVDHEELVILGVPAPLLPAVRALRTEADLAELLEHVPEDAAYALIQLAAGRSAAEVLDDLDQKKAEIEAPDPDDLVSAVTRPEAQQHFVVVETDEALQDILSRPLDKWRVFLHPTQRKVVERHATGPCRVLGGAGTGKTVVAMHRARHLARKLIAAEAPASRKILVTTFTRNLANDIAANLDHLCSDAERARVEVMNLHHWASQHLMAQGVRFDVMRGEEPDELWDQVTAEAPAGLPAAFYREEWDHVVQAEDVLDRAAYFKVSRKGRGTPLTRKQRAAVWKVFEAYRAGLDARGKVELADVIREARLNLEKNPGTLPYDAVVADEIQDFRAADLRLLRALVPEKDDDLFLVGDAHQRIYRYRASLSACGIQARGRRSSRLRINYRTTDAIRRLAVSVLEGVTVDDLDEGTDTLKGYRSLREGTAPRVDRLSSPEAEGRLIVETVQRWLDAGVEPRAICIGARTRDLVQNRYVTLLHEAGVEAVEIDTHADAHLGPGVRVATLHRMKGLEFSRVLLASVNAGTIPLRLSDEKFADQGMRQDWEVAERSLFHVAATRARDELVVTAYGPPSPFLG